MCKKMIVLTCLVLVAGLGSNAVAAVAWTDENGIGSNHNWADPGNWARNEVPEGFDAAWVNYSTYSKAPDGQGPIIDSNVGVVAHLKVGSSASEQPSVLTVEDGGMLRIKRFGRYPPDNGQLVVGQSGDSAGTIEMKGGKIIVESMCQLGRRPGRGLLLMSGDGEFIVKGPLKLGGMDRGPGDAFIQLDAGIVRCDGMSMYIGESKIDIAGGTLIAGPGRLDLTRYPKAKMSNYIKRCRDSGMITAYNGKGKLVLKDDSPEQKWVEVYAVMEEPNSPEEPGKKQEAKENPADANQENQTKEK